MSFDSSILAALGSDVLTPFEYASYGVKSKGCSLCVRFSVLFWNSRCQLTNMGKEFAPMLKGK